MSKFCGYYTCSFLLYGAFATVIGHELTHGFDDQGIMVCKKQISSNAGFKVNSLTSMVIG